HNSSANVTPQLPLRRVRPLRPLREAFRVRFAKTIGQIASCCGTTEFKTPNRYLSFFSRVPSMSNDRFSPPLSTAPFPLSLSPVIVNLYSTSNLLSPSTRTAEKVNSPSFSFTSLSFASFWSGQLIVPASLSPSFVIVSVDVRCWSPILYSHFHVPIGSDFSPCAPARPQNASANAIGRIDFMFASRKFFGEKMNLVMMGCFMREN